MANQRAPGQTFIGCWANKQFLAKIEEARGTTPRSQWVRDAIADLLIKKGFKIEPEDTAAPDRTGKGGKKPGRYLITSAPASQLNDKTNSGGSGSARALKVVRKHFGKS